MVGKPLSKNDGKRTQLEPKLNKNEHKKQKNQDSKTQKNPKQKKTRNVKIYNQQTLKFDKTQKPNIEIIPRHPSNPP